MLASRILPLKCDVQTNLHSILVCEKRTPLPPYTFNGATVRDSAKYIVGNDQRDEKKIEKGNAFGRFLCCRLFMIFSLFLLMIFQYFFLHRNSHRHLVRSHCCKCSYHYYIFQTKVMKM